MYKIALYWVTFFFFTISCSNAPDMNPDEQAVRKVVKHLKKRFPLSLKEYRVNIDADKGIMTVVLNMKENFDKDDARKVMLAAMRNILQEFNTQKELQDEVLIYPLQDNHIEIEIFPIAGTNEKKGDINHAWLSNCNLHFYIQGEKGELYEDAETIEEALAYIRLKHPKFSWR